MGEDSFAYGIDSGGMLGRVLGFPDELARWLDATDPPDTSGLSGCEGVVIAGMGGSAIGADLLAGAYGAQMTSPLLVARGTTAPRFVRKGWTVIGVSYSGNTRETLGFVRSASERGAAVAAVSAGGALADLAAERGWLHLRLPGGSPPRAAIHYLIASLARLLVPWSGKPVRDLAEALPALGAFSRSLSPSAPAGQNPAKDLAIRCRGRLAAFYGAEMTAAVAARAACQFNENAKALARWAVLPEAAHNDIVAVASDPEVRRHQGVFFPFEGMSPDLRVQMDEVRSHYERMGAGATVFNLSGSNPMESVLRGVLIVDAASVYLALLRKVDPTPVTPIEDLKARMSGRT